MIGTNWDPAHGQEPVPESINDTLLCFQRGSNCNCPLKYSTYYPMEIETDSFPNIRQNLGSFIVKLGEGLRDPTRSGIPMEDQQC